MDIASELPRRGWKAGDAPYLSYFELACCCYPLHFKKRSPTGHGDTRRHHPRGSGTCAFSTAQKKLYIEPNQS
eukprot:s422_g42.t1